MNRPLKIIAGLPQEVQQNLFERHFEWCMEIRDATLRALKDKADVSAARSSFAHADKVKPRTWYDAEAKVQTFGRIHAWSLSERVGLPKRYQSEGRQIADSFMSGDSWQGWRPWDNSTYACTKCDGEFINPNQYNIHPCATRSNSPESPRCIEKGPDSSSHPLLRGT